MELASKQEEEEEAILQLESQLDALVVTIRQLEEQVDSCYMHSLQKAFYVNLFLGGCNNLTTSGSAWGADGRGGS